MSLIQMAHLNSLALKNQSDLIMCQIRVLVALERESISSREKQVFS